jgi:predicted dehydrogenase
MISVGLVGSGYWAETIHAPAIAALGDAGTHGIWGRNKAASQRIATAHGLRAFASFEELLAAVELVDLAVPPAVQADLAVQAAQAGKHLLLEKPMALSVLDARRIEAAVSEAGVAAVVFLTRLFEPVRSAWLRDQAWMGHVGGHVEWISAALTEGSPYAASGWRLEGGALWDVGPHIVSQLVAVLGRTTAVSVTSHDPLGETSLSLQHEGGAVSTVRMTLHADPADKTEAFEFWGERGRAASPGTPLDFPASYERALATLMSQVHKGDRHADADYTVHANVELTKVLCAIEALIRASRFETFVPLDQALSPPPPP